MNPVFPRSWRKVVPKVLFRLWPFTYLRGSRLHAKQVQSRNVNILVAVLLIFGLTVFLRAFRLTEVPPIFNPDEASIAYNAYLLLETGKDEWGRSWPLILEAFGDQKIGGYTYLVVASYALFGVSDFAVRLPAMLAGVGIVFAAGLWIYLLHRPNGFFSQSKSDSFPVGVALITMALLAIQPLFIWYSRVAFEATVALLLTLGLSTVLYSVYPAEHTLHNSVKRNLLYALLYGVMILCMGTSVFLYNVPLVLIPFLFVVVPIWYGLKRWKFWLPVVLVGLVTWLVLLFSMQGLTAQKSKITLFGDPHVQFEQVAYYQQFEDPIQRKVLGNKYVFYTREVVERFFASLHPDFIVENIGGHPWHSYPNSGYITLPVYVLSWFGLIGTAWFGWVERSRVSKKLKVHFLMAYLLFISLIPAVITVNAPHATRTLLFFVVWIYFAAVGIVMFSQTVQMIIAWLITNSLVVKASFVRRFGGPAILVILAAIIAWPSAQYAQTILFSPRADTDWGAGLRAGFSEFIAQVEAEYPNNQTIAIHDEQGFWYIVTAWYADISADEFINTIQREAPTPINFSYGSAVGRFVFIKNRGVFRAEQPDVPILYWEDGWQLEQ